jgi:DNA-binding HxlR family transcriptional regulator
VQYSLTPKGRASLPVVEALRSFGETWLSDEEKTLLLRRYLALRRQ